MSYEIGIISQFSGGEPTTDQLRQVVDLVRFREIGRDLRRQIAVSFVAGRCFAVRIGPPGSASSRAALSLRASYRTSDVDNGHEFGVGKIACILRNEFF